MRALDPDLAVVIASPGASRIRDAGERERVVGAVGEALRRRGHHGVEVVVTGDPGAIGAAAGDAVARGAVTVALVGGDGTVRDAAGALAGSGTAVGIVPAGTGNLFAAALGVPRSIDRAIALIASGRPRACDIGRVRFERVGQPEQAMPFTVACGTGFDARVMAATSPEAKRRYGVVAYLLAASRVLGHLRPQPTAVTVDGVRTELTSVAVLVMNAGEAIPGGLRPRLPVPVDDGLLHAFVLPRGGIVGGVQGVVELLLATSTGPSPSGSGVRLVGRQIRVEVTPPAPVEVDGDPFEPAVVNAEVMPAALAVLRP